jgi:CDP-2,3-bis-(O-geranylgeranyl)-sn-glycerol synthase
VLALLLTPIVSLWLGLGWWLGIVVAIFAMLGDLFSSFIKRRLGMPSSTMALGLDQVPEALFPLLACHLLVEMTLLQTGLLVLLFFVLELVLSRILYWLHIRCQPF